MSFNENNAQNKVKEIYDEMNLHKHYAQELHAILKLSKSIITKTEEYADRGPDNQGPRVVKTRITEPVDPVMGNPMTEARKNEILTIIQSRLVALRTKKP